MPRPAAALIKLPYMPSANLAAFGREVHNAMNGNPDFPNPDVPMTDLAAMVAELEAQIDASYHGDLMAKARQQRARRDLTAALRKMARYVNHIAYGNEALILKSGFPLAGVPVRHKEAQMEQPRVEDVRVLSDGGGVAFKVSAVKGAVCYTALVSRAGAGEGRHVGRTVLFEEAAPVAAIHSSRQRKMEIRGLARATAYEVCVFATGTYGASPLSQAVRFVTQ